MNRLSTPVWGAFKDNCESTLKGARFILRFSANNVISICKALGGSHLKAFMVLSLYCMKMIFSVCNSFISNKL